MYLQNKAVRQQNPNFSVCKWELYINWTLISQSIWSPQLHGLLESFSPLEFIHDWATTTILRKLIGGNSLKECCCYCTHSLKHTGSLHYSARNILIQLHQKSCSLYKFSEKKKLFFCSRIRSGSFRNSFRFLFERKKILEKWKNLKEFLKFLIFWRQWKNFLSWNTCWIAISQWVRSLHTHFSRM